MHYDLQEILYSWQFNYCSGYYMPYDFRKNASNAFSEAYLECKELKEYKNIFKTNKTIYRVHGLDPEDNPILKFNGLYYSFSNDVDGLSRVVKFDRNLRCDLIIIEVKPQEALNFNELHNKVWGFYPDKFAEENEILSKFSKSNIVSIYYLKYGNDIRDYKKKGIKINIEDANLPYDNFIKKYNIE